MSASRMPERIHRSAWVHAAAAVVAASMIGPSTSAQSARPPIKVQTLNHMALTVTDVSRTLRFYQSLFDMRNYAATGSVPRLQIGNGPQSLSLRSGSPGLALMTLGVAQFNPDEIMKALAARGVTRAAAAGRTPMTAWTSKRGETTELFFNDPGGLTVQLQDVSYCGGSGPLGERCPATPIDVQPSRAPARLSTINHVILLLPDPDRSKAFFQDLFGMRDGKFVGPGPQWLGFQKSPDGRIGVDHFCFGLENFDPKGAMRRFVEFGLTLQEGDARAQGARTDWGLAAPMRTRGFMRPPSAPGREMPIEVFVSDPDNFQIQVNDVNFCGGDGWLGDKCS